MRETLFASVFSPSMKVGCGTRFHVGAAGTDEEDEDEDEDESEEDDAFDSEDEAEMTEEMSGEEQGPAAPSRAGR